MRLRILCLDGGSRGLLVCELLRRLEQERPGLLDSIDVLAGTSSGSAIAAVLATAGKISSGLQPATSMFEVWNPFEGSSPLDARFRGAIAGQNALLTHGPLYRQLARLLGETRVAEARRKIIIPTVLLDNHASLPRYRRWTVETYHNLGQEMAVHHIRLLDVVMRSCAVPILYPAFQGHVDGGVFANNPSLDALVTAQDFLDTPQEDILVLSIGQGISTHKMELASGDIGYGHWLLNPQLPGALIRLVLTANEQATTYYCSRLLRDRFVRVDPNLGAEIEPHADKPQEVFCTEQKQAAEAADLSVTLEHLDGINWFGEQD